MNKDARLKVGWFGYAQTMFDGVSKREVIAWVVCLVIAAGLTVVGTTYLVNSYLTADVSETLSSHR